MIALYQRICLFDWPTQGAILLLLFMSLCSVTVGLVNCFNIGDYRRHAGRMTMLATISATAPFVGVFGTIMHLITSAFAGCGAQRWLCIDATIAAVSDALWVMELGLAIGVLSFWCYRYFVAKMERINSVVQAVGRELRPHLPSFF